MIYEEVFSLLAVEKRLPASLILDAMVLNTQQTSECYAQVVGQGLLSIVISVERNQGRDLTTLEDRIREKFNVTSMAAVYKAEKTKKW